MAKAVFRMSFSVRLGGQRLGEPVRGVGEQAVFHRYHRKLPRPVHFRFDKHAFKVGEYVSVTEHDGITRPFRVVAVELILQA